MPPPEEGNDDSGGFFAVGREIESINDNHKFTDAEKAKMAKFESLEYQQCNSAVYRSHLDKEHSTDAHGKKDFNKWIVVGLIGFFTGLVAFFLRQTLGIISRAKKEELERLIDEEKFGTAWVWYVLYGLVFCSASSFVISFVHPPAGGSGVPDTIAMLNGVHVPLIMNIKTFAAKWFSCATAVGSGLPVGPEGPMIHMGAMVGAGICQGRSKTFGFNLPFFQQFRNARDRRDFTVAGAAAGVAAAFGAPVGGVLFAMEEVASYWEAQLMWLVFFGTMVAVTTQFTFVSVLNAYQLTGTPFGQITDEASILFPVVSQLNMNIGAIIVAVITGCIGGGTGALFTFINLKINRFRAAKIAPFPLRRMAEVALIMVIVSTIGVFLPFAFPCQKTTPNVEDEILRYGCAEDEFHPAATLLFIPGEETIKHLFTRNTFHEYEIGLCLTLFILYFFLACWAAGSAVSSGIVVPMLLIGASYGRAIGVVMIHIFDEAVLDPANAATFKYEWMDPGVWALIGAASFFGGVSRLTVALVVIMVEISNDTHFLLPIMAAVMTSKRIADSCTHGLYHALMEMKCLPFLDTVPYHPKGLDSFQTKQIMASPVVSVEEVSTVSAVIEALKSSHNGFPVVEKTANGNILKGGLSRLRLETLLRAHGLFTDEPNATPELQVDHNSLDRPEDDAFASDELAGGKRGENAYAHIADGDLGKYLDLRPYMNTSCHSVHETFSIRQTYQMFRAMALRHLFIINHYGVCTGVITRKDLVGQHIDEMLGEMAAHRQSVDAQFGSVELEQIRTLVARNSNAGAGASGADEADSSAVEAGDALHVVPLAPTVKSVAETDDDDAGGADQDGSSVVA